ITERETLEDLRRRITPSIISENANSKWRFIYQVIEIDPRNVLTIPYDDAVFGISMESKVKVVDFVEGRNTIYMANPVLLERVRALKKESIGYNNVLVCEEGTAIEIQINAFSRGGIGYSLKSDGGDHIVDNFDPMPAPPKRTPSHELPSDAIANATIVEGQPTGVIHQKATHFGQNRDEKIGTVGIDLFVFKSIEAANKVFQINATIKT
ncbi:hypothetical protein Bhyg_16512, partial [Pseudolycoriella hygida]